MEERQLHLFASTAVAVLLSYYLPNCLLLRQAASHQIALANLSPFGFVAGVVNPPKNGDEPRAENRHTAHHGQPSKAVTACRIKRILLIRQEKSSLGKRLVRRVSISYARFPRNPRNTRVPNLADRVSYTPCEDILLANSCSRYKTISDRNTNWIFDHLLLGD